MFRRASEIVERWIKLMIVVAVLTVICSRFYG